MTLVQGEGAGKWHGRGRLQGQGPLASGVRASNRKAEACPILWKVGPHGLGQAGSPTEAIREGVHAEVPGWSCLAAPGIRTLAQLGRGWRIFLFLSETATGIHHQGSLRWVSGNRPRFGRWHVED